MAGRSASRSPSGGSKSGDLHWYDLFGSRPSRRDFLRLGGGVAGLIALGALPGRGSGRSLRFQENPFPLGVASGEPSSTGGVLWTRLDHTGLVAAGSGGDAVDVRWELAADDGFARIVRSGDALAPAELGHSVHVELDGLDPARDYWYRFFVSGDSSPVGRLRTAPDPSVNPGEMRFAFASCQQYEHGYYTAYRHMAEEELDLVVHLGDYIYERTWGEIRPRAHEGPEIITLDDYRARYGTYKSDPDLQVAHASVPWIVTWDDHEVDNNYAADVPEDDQDRESFLLRRAAAYQAYYEFMPLRRTSMPNGPDLRLYRRLPYGTLAQFHVLDTRQYRTDQPCGDRGGPLCDDAWDEQATLTGAEQERWLFDGLSASRARWNVLAQQIRVHRLIAGENRNQSKDSWDGYPAARRRLLDYLAAERPSNPVVLTGDVHTNWAADIPADFDDPDSDVLASEFVGTSITSGGDGSDGSDRLAGFQSQNPHIKYFNNRRGYVRCTLTDARWTSDYRTVDYVTEPGAPIRTDATFVVEDGAPGVRRG